MDDRTQETTMDDLYDSDPPDTLSASNAVIMKATGRRESLDEENGKVAWNETDDSMTESQIMDQDFIDACYDDLYREHEISKSTESREPKVEEKRKPVESSSVLKRSDLRSLKTCFGKDVASYLKESNIVEKKSVSKTYVLSKDEGFEECYRLAKDRHEKRNKPIERVTKIAHRKPAPPKQKNCYDSPEGFRRIVNSDRAKVRSKINDIKGRSLCETFGVATNLAVSFEECYGATESIEWLSIPHGRKRDITCEWDYEKMFKLMMQTKIGCEQMIDYASCFDDLTKILSEFHRKHEKFEYRYKLQHIMNLKKLGQSQKIQPVTLHQFQKYFNQIFFEVVPLSLFGKHRNVKKVRKALKQYFIVAFNDKISLTTCVHSFDISCITWLRPIRDEATRWSVIAKVTKWIFEKYLCVVLKTVFSVQKALNSEQKVFMCTADWTRSKCRYIQREEKIGSVKRIGLNSRLPVMCIVPSGEMKLFPKSTGVRPIHVIRYANNIREESALLRTLLEQCYLEKYKNEELSNLHSVWRSQTTRTKRRKNNRLYLVACDVTEAYGSIIQTILFDIINEMINEIPAEKLRVQWFKILHRSKWEGDIIIGYKRCFTCCPELPVIQSRALVRPFRSAHYLPVYIEKPTAIRWIKDYVFNQSFQFNNARYIQKLGVVQGSLLSPILSKIYYSHMKVREFRSFVKSGHLIKFIDDFLYVTKNEAEAKRFLEAIGEGISVYNCRFGSSKTQTNVESTLCRRSETIDFLGYRLNGTTLEVQPHFDFRSFRYSKWLREVYGGNSIKLFTGRLINKYALKMNKLVLSHKINSVNMLVENAGLIARMMSLRCGFFISTIFDDISKFSKPIMETICVAVGKIARKFKHRLRLYGRQVRSSIMRRILIVIWTSFLRVFSRNIEIRKCFYNKIRRKIERLNAY